MYQLEKCLVDDFLNCLTSTLESPWGSVRTKTEFSYTRGRTDVIALTDDGEIIAFEAKLRNWRDALHQAYRNTCFAHRSYIVVPEETAEQAVRHASEFKRRSVGLCYPANDRVVVALEASHAPPLQTWLAGQAMAVLSGEDTSGGLQ